MNQHLLDQMNSCSLAYRVEYQVRLFSVICSLFQLEHKTFTLTFTSPSHREKRRRCKVDPNLGIKNPSFCDTDAYFGAADYGMRNMWDSAGRR